MYFEVKIAHFIHIRNDLAGLHHRKLSLHGLSLGGSNAERVECRMMKYSKCGLNAERHWAECRTGGMPKGLNAEYYSNSNKTDEKL